MRKLPWGEKTLPKLARSQEEKAADTGAIDEVKTNAKGADRKKKKPASTRSIGECHGVFTEFLIIFKVKTNAVVANNDDPDWVDEPEVVAAEVQDQPQGTSTAPTDIGISHNFNNSPNVLGSCRPMYETGMQVYKVMY